MSQPIDPEHFVFVVTPPDLVNAGLTAKKLITGLRGEEAVERESRRYFTVDGEELDLVDPTRHGVWLVHTGRDGSADLREALARVANHDPEATTDPRSVANEALCDLWQISWPTKPKWLHHLIYGRQPPTAKPHR